MEEDELRARPRSECLELGEHRLHAVTEAILDGVGVAEPAADCTQQALLQPEGPDVSGAAGEDMPGLPPANVTSSVSRCT